MLKAMDIYIILISNTEINNPSFLSTGIFQHILKYETPTPPSHFGYGIEETIGTALSV